MSSVSKLGIVVLAIEILMCYGGLKRMSWQVVSIYMIVALASSVSVE